MRIGSSFRPGAIVKFLVLRRAGNAVVFDPGEFPHAARGKKCS